MEKNRQDLDHSYQVQIQIQGRFKMGRKVQLHKIKYGKNSGIYFLQILEHVTF